MVKEASILELVAKRTNLAVAVEAAAVKERGSMVHSVIALITGILILVFPAILNYIVAIYLILIGILGIVGYGA